MGFTVKVSTNIDISKSIASALKDMVNKSVLVGIPENKSERKREAGEKKEPINNAALGYIQEHGSAVNNIPPRPFLQPGVNDSIPQVTEIMKKGGEKTLSQESTIDKTLGLAGTVAVASVKKRITQSIDMKPLLPATVARRKRKTNGKKGNSKFSGERPLLDTAQLMNSVTYVVDKK